MKKQSVVNSVLTKEQWTEIDNELLSLARMLECDTPTAREFAAGLPDRAQMFLDATSVDAVDFARALGGEGL